MYYSIVETLPVSAITRFLNHTSHLCENQARFANRLSLSTYRVNEKDKESRRRKYIVLRPIRKLPTAGSFRSDRNFELRYHT